MLRSVTGSSPEDLTQKLNDIEESEEITIVSVYAASVGYHVALIRVEDRTDGLMSMNEN